MMRWIYTCLCLSVALAQSGNVGSHRFISAASTVISSFDGRGSEQNSKVESCVFVPDDSTVISSLDSRGSEQNCNAGSSRFVSNGSTVISSLDGRGQEHMESLKSDVVLGIC